jgi:hypothetical protein
MYLVPYTKSDFHTNLLIFGMEFYLTPVTHNFVRLAIRGYFECLTRGKDDNR